MTKDQNKTVATNPPKSKPADLVDVVMRCTGLSKLAAQSWLKNCKEDEKKSILQSTKPGVVIKKIQDRIANDNKAADKETES